MITALPPLRPLVALFLKMLLSLHDCKPLLYSFTEFRKPLGLS